MRVTLNKEYGFKRMARIYFLDLILVGVFSTEATAQTFDSILNLSATPGESKTAHLAVNGSNIYVVWQDNTPGNWDIFFRRSTDGGATFSPPINLSANPGESRLPHKLGGGGCFPRSL